MEEPIWIPIESEAGPSSSFSLSGTEEARWDQLPKLLGGKQASTAEAAAWPSWQGLKRPEEGLC